MHKLLRRIVDVRVEEVGSLLWSFAYFFCLLCSYYVLRPIRDAMGIAGGVKDLPWLFTATFVTMLLAAPLFGLAASRWPRRRFIPLIYRFFGLNLLIFFVVLRIDAAPVHAARVFFVWTSVFNLFVVSVFWSVMADLWRSEQGKRLFGFIAAGGSAGALAGPLLTGRLAERLGSATLLLVSVVLLEIGVQCALRVLRDAPSARSAAPDEPIRGGVLQGIGLVFRSPYLLGIAAQMLLTTTAATFLYLQQASIVAAATTSFDKRSSLFADIDLIVNLTTIVIQTAVTGRILTRAGLAVALGLVPAATGLGFIGLMASPTLWVVTAFQALRRAVHYAIERPAREVLFTVTSPEEKYKSKNFIDTVVFRGGDAASAWAHAALFPLAGLAGVAAAMVSLSAVWIVLATYLAKGHAARARADL